MGKLDNNKYYSARQIVRQRFFPWINSLPTLTRMIDENKDLFKPIIREGTTGKRYLIKGEVINEILKSAVLGKLEIKTE